ncbi:hypothetical protein RHGRI_004897 [Rhododendron griersonianum]|uniref:Uncharacterized protein n=1 Tax=Rhododendron griersonianum TaxID=479676 RepID=A0AAV6LBD9_9ERIC|nr:hypothetical protein RHGRI_004897 [Rhododendron griersonianum]
MPFTREETPPHDPLSYATDSYEFWCTDATKCCPPLPLSLSHRIQIGPLQLRPQPRLLTPLLGQPQVLNFFFATAYFPTIAATTSPPSTTPPNAPMLPSTASPSSMTMQRQLTDGHPKRTL